MKLAAQPLTSRRRNSFPPSISIGRAPTRSPTAWECVDFPPKAENSARSGALAAGRAPLCPAASRQIGKNAPASFYCAQPFTGRISFRRRAPKARHYTHHASAICRDAQKSVRTLPPKAATAFYLAQCRAIFAKRILLARAVKYRMRNLFAPSRFAAVEVACRRQATSRRRNSFPPSILIKGVPKQCSAPFGAVRASGIIRSPFCCLGVVGGQSVFQNFFAPALPTGARRASRARPHTLRLLYASRAFSPSLPRPRPHRAGGTPLTVTQVTIRRDVLHRSDCRFFTVRA